jgi:hypothetical protein
MDAPACAVGRLTAGGPWVGFAPTIDDGYALVVGTDRSSVRGSATAADILALALAYFEERLVEPPEELAATHGDIGAIVRHAADRVVEEPLGRALRDAVDAIDDGLAADAVIERLAHAFGAGGDPIGHLRRRATELLGVSAP